MKIRIRTMLLAVILPAASTVLIMWGALWPWPDDAAPPSGHKPVARSRVTPVVFRDNAVDGVRAELAELRADVSRIGSAAAPRQEQPPAERRARALERAAAQRELLEKTLAADTRDPGWSAQTEHAVHEAFATAGLRKARLDGVTCSKTLCRITLVFDSLEARHEGSGAVADLAQWPSRGFGMPSPDDPLRYVFYASRDPDSFPGIE